jgi:hypothetical protein
MAVYTLHPEWFRTNIFLTYKEEDVGNTWGHTPFSFNEENPLYMDWAINQYIGEPCEYLSIFKDGDENLNWIVNLDLDVLGYIAPEVTVNIIKDGQIDKKLKLTLPKMVKNVIKCKNPRCITSVEQGIDHVFKLVDEEKRIYRCIYCESKAK